MPKKVSKKYKGGGIISVSPEDKNIYYNKLYKNVSSAFKGENIDEEEKFPKHLGAKHPFNFEDMETLYKKYGVINEALSKISGDIVTDFEIKVDNPNAQAIIDDFIEDTTAHGVFETWVKEALGKGNGFIETDLENSKMRVLNANNMFVKRNKKSEVKNYFQWAKGFKNFKKDSKDLIKFEPEEIAHLSINKIPGDPYGIGIVYPNERNIENVILNEQDLQEITSRKAGAPYHVKVGVPGAIVPQNVVDNVRTKLQFLSNTHEWVTDGDIEIKSVDFTTLGNSLIQTQEYFFKQVIFGMPIPEVLFGSGQLNEGIAKVQLEDYKRRISRYQKLIGSVIEEKIIRPLLNKHGFDEQVTFIWDLPTEDDINKRIEQIRELQKVYFS